MTRKFNHDDLRKATRMITNHPEDVVLGIACYEGKAQGDEWVSHHAGTAKNGDDAEAWLRGEDVQLVRIIPRQGKEEAMSEIKWEDVTTAEPVKLAEPKPVRCEECGVLIQVSDDVVFRVVRATEVHVAMEPVHLDCALANQR